MARWLFASTLLGISIWTACQPSPSPEMGTKKELIPYMEQALPGKMPQLFGPGVVSSGLWDYGMTFTPEGDACYWSVSWSGFETIVGSKWRDGAWSAPEVAPFASQYLDGYPSIRPDGARLYFHSMRPMNSSQEVSNEANIWYVEKTGTDWGVPRPLSPSINSPRTESGPSVSKNGTLYFTRWIDDQNEKIFRSRYQDGKHLEPECLFPELNAFHVYVAPDETYLIIPLNGRDDAVVTGYNYYVSFRNANDQWSGLINLGETVNFSSSMGAHCGFSPDGKYFFFCAFPQTQHLTRLNSKPTYHDLQKRRLTIGDRGGEDVYWIDAAVIEALRPEGF